MNQHFVSAMFDTQAEADRAVSDLRNAGVADSAISLIARHDDENVATDASGAEVGRAATDVIGKTALGAGIGTALGVAALAIPGVGPFVAAGAIAASAIPGAALTGAAVGAAAGGIAGLLTDHGVSREDAAYYERGLGEGGVFVSVDASDSDVDARQAQDILYRNGGHSSSRQRGSAYTGI